MVPLLFPPPNLNFYTLSPSSPSIKGTVCITIDDCFVRQDKKSYSLSSVVKNVLGVHKATFFTTLLYSTGKWKEEEIVKVIKDGHEVSGGGGREAKGEGSERSELPDNDLYY